MGIFHTIVMRFSNNSYETEGICYDYDTSLFGFFRFRLSDPEFERLLLPARPGGNEELISEPQG